MSSERDAKVAKAEKLLSKVQCVPGLADAKKLRKCLSAIESALRAKISKGPKSPASRRMQKNTETESKVA